MVNKGLKILAVLTFVLGTFVFFTDKSDAQTGGCVVHSVQWVSTQAVVGQPATFIINVRDIAECTQPNSVFTNLWEQDPISFDDFLPAIPISAGSSNQITVIYTPTEADYNAGDDFGEGSNEEIYLTAYGSEQGQSRYETSNIIPFYRSPPPSVTITCNGQASCDIAPGETVTIAWSSTNVTGCGVGAFAGTWTGTSGSQTINNLQSTTTYTATCSSSSGASVSASVTVNVNVPPTDTCNSGNLFLASQADIVWGDLRPGIVPSDMITSTGSQVRFSVSGESSCTGRQMTVQILNSSGSPVGSTLDLDLILGNQLTNTNPAKYQLYADWTNNLQPGDYRFRVISPQQAGPSANLLTIQAVAQPCSISRVFATPIRIDFGQTFTISVEVQGTCNGWSASLYVTGPNGVSDVVFNGSPQTFLGTNRLDWNWTPTQSPLPGSQYVYVATGNIGNQSVQSNPFTVSGVTIQPPPLPPPQPSPTNPFAWNLGTNPFSGGNNIICVINSISIWIFQISVPIFVIIVLYAGLLFLLSRGDSGKVTTARKTLWYALLGLAVVLIGRGFVSLIVSILGASSGTSFTC